MTSSLNSNSRWLSRRGLLLGAAGAAAACAWKRPAATAKTPEQDGLAAAVDYLWSQQAEDGGWHSPQYGVLRGGQSLTPFVLHALLGTIDTKSSDQWGRSQRACGFMLERLDGKGALGRHDADVLEYPVYSTAYALQCFDRVQTYHDMMAEEGHKAIAKMREFLLAAQFDESNGFSPADPAYGGWGFQEALKPGDSGHMDLAHTRRALQALELQRPLRENAAVARKAQAFLRVVQNHPQAAARPHVSDDGSATIAPPPSFDRVYDGGFFFSPMVLAANKGRVEDEPAPHWRSYATATCDGLLALLSAGVPREDERVTSAVAWLKQHTNLDYPQGVPEEHPEPWGAALRFYHYAVRAEVYRRLEWPAAERAQLAALVREKQNADGSFANRESSLMKEDDPLLCTALAVVALSNCLSA